MEFSTIALLIVLISGSLYIWNLKVNLTISRTHVIDLTKVVDLQARKIATHLTSIEDWERRFRDLALRTEIFIPKLKVDFNKFSHDHTIAEAFCISEDREKELGYLASELIAKEYPNFTNFGLFIKLTSMARNLEEFMLLTIMAEDVNNRLRRRDLFLLAEISQYQHVNGIVHTPQKKEEIPVERTEENICADCDQRNECTSLLKDMV